MATSPPFGTLDSDHYLTRFQADALRQIADRLNDRPAEVVPDVEPDTYGLTWDALAAQQENLRTVLVRLADELED